MMTRAQSDDDQSAASALGLSDDVKLLAPRDPSVRKATAIINGAIITDTDVDQRLALVLASSNGKIPDDERERLRAQVLSNLIDETLEIQEAAANKITIEKSEVAASYARAANQFKKTPAEFSAMIKGMGSSDVSLKRQIEGEMAWRRLLGREVEPFVSVSDEEVNQVIKRMQADKGAPEYHVSEIYLSATPANEQQVAANAQRILEQIRQGASFPAYARQYSEASTAPVGGDLGWVRAERLPDQLANAVKDMTPGQVGGPIPVGGGFSIIALVDKRQVLTTDPRDALVTLKQITISFPANVDKATAQPKVTAFTEDLKTLKGCGNVADFAKKWNAEIVDSDQIKIRDLPPQLQPILIDLRVGEATPPFGGSEGGVHSLVVCGRDDPIDKTVPSFDEVSTQMSDERVNMRARRYLRDIRRDAVIEYR
ncbi:MAG TPA: peptidylprolyl isomerase [Sphingomonas sp.]|uniref:peptidylprolyl isomerase n=1 Tax=Sphingomonas sp. TaxID=28214 RepID=UPI002CDA158A|nr:peptidylprolyl isomerase [Sphingomonas sp.]HMI20728.1 peptidylprolyl isomerase [Sphingomonas sp.]